MGYLGITAVCFAALPIIATLFMPNYYLGKQQNAADNRGLDGEIVIVPDIKQDASAGVEKDKGTWYYRLRDAYRR